MAQTNFSETNLKNSKFDSFSNEDFVKKVNLLEEENIRLVRENYELRKIQITDEQLRTLNETIYGTSSERHKKPENKKKLDTPPAPRVKKPSKRYPNIPVREIPIALDPRPGCDVFGKQMSDSGMTESVKR